MDQPTIAVMSPGDMGQAVAALLRRHGLRVITCLAGRSARTAALAEAAGLETVASEQELVRAADILLSIMVPAAAQPFAQRIAAVLGDADTELLYVDCNAVAPHSAQAMAGLLEAAGARFVDAGIIGPPPRRQPEATRFYASGPEVARFARLAEHGLAVRPLGERVGDASAIKMCYAALTKGTTALMAQLSIAAARLGVQDALQAEFADSQAALHRRMQGAVPEMVPKAHRWVGEMEEIAAAFEAAGVTGKGFAGAAATYAAIAQTPLAQTSPEDWAAAAPSYAQVIRALA